jgi:membrane-bound lytic murein transglycosylase D
MWRQYQFSAAVGGGFALLTALASAHAAPARAEPRRAEPVQNTADRKTTETKAARAPAETKAERSPAEPKPKPERSSAEPNAARAAAASKPAAPPKPAARSAEAPGGEPAPIAPRGASADASRVDAEVDDLVRAARQELLALVARDAAAERDSARIEPAARGPVLVGTPPPSLTSAAPAARKGPPVSTRNRLDWLEGLALPDLPVRWDDRLIRLLDHYRNDPRAKASMRGLLTRKGRYISLLRAKLRAAQLPEDLVYVAMVESAYDPRARSEAGALGMWQLMTAPASGYGLEMTRWVDERASVSRSTDAAIDYLRDLREDLGSWPLALAAFNMGHSALLRSMQKYNTNDFWLLSALEAGLPFETVTYVAKISAFAIIGRNPGRFGLGDVVPDAPTDTLDVALPGGTSLARIARVAGVDVERLAELNPELKKARLPPDEKSWDVHVPRDRAARLKEKWASSQVMPAHRVHALRLGERLSDVADRYGTTTAKLRALNDLSEASEVRAGFKLRVPDVDPIARPEPELPTVGVLGDRFVYADRKRVFYRAAEGDELSEIAQFFRVSVDEILLWNRIAHASRLQRGMFLQLFVPEDADLSQTLVLTPNEVRTLTVGSEEFFNFHETQQNRTRIRYRVKPGDTLKSLSQRFDLSIGSLARINQFSRDTKLTPDSEIIVYVAKSK